MGAAVSAGLVSHKTPDGAHRKGKECCSGHKSMTQDGWRMSVLHKVYRGGVWTPWFLNRSASSTTTVLINRFYCLYIVVQQAVLL